MNILIALLVFGILIFVHELGHFVACRIFGVRVNEFAVGMGPKVVSHKSKKSGTVYSLRLLPIGGFNSIEGEDEESESEDALCSKPVWQRMIIIVAGAVFNIVFAMIIMCIIVIATDKLGSTVVATVYPPETQNESAEQAPSDVEYNGAVSNTYEKLMPKDKIIKINGKRVHVVDELLYTVAFECTEPVTVTVVRDGKRVTLENVVFPTYESGGAVFGTIDFSVYREKKTVFTVVKHSWFNCVSTFETIWESIIGLVSGRFGVEHVSGPVGVTEALGDAAKNGALTVMNMAVMISMNLGVFNLLPIPALDGGRFVFLVIEAIRRKPINRETEATIHTVAIMILMGLMIVITFKDIIFMVR